MKIKKQVKSFKYLIPVLFKSFRFKLKIKVKKFLNKK